MILDLKMQFNRRKHPDSAGEHYVWVIQYSHGGHRYPTWLDVLIIDERDL